MNVTNRYIFLTFVSLFLMLAGVVAPVAIGAEAGSVDVPLQTYVDEGGLSSEYITSKADAAGFTDVYNVTFEHGLYEIKAHNPEGQIVKIYLDPKSGELVEDIETGKIRFKTVIRAEADQALLPWEDIISQVKAEGYIEIYSIHYDHQLYEIHARDTQNRVFELFVNPNTGNLLRHPTTGKPLSERVDK